jgi:plasmid stabilization system protein ParE
MNLPVVYLPEARDDIDAAYSWFEGQRAGLGDQFLDAFREVVDQLRDQPQLYAIIRRDIRAALLRRFPYVVYYCDRGSDILIIAVQHGRRSSRAWRGRA